MLNTRHCKFFGKYGKGKVSCGYDGSIKNSCYGCPHFKPNWLLSLHWKIHGEYDKLYGYKRKTNLTFTETCIRNTAAQYWSGRLE